MSAPPSAPPPPVPRYGTGALADLPPSVLSTLRVPDGANVLGLPPADRVCVLLIDGLGWEQLRAHPREAPFLNSLGGRAIDAGLPATTVTSIGSLGTGLTPGTHGLLGLQVAIPGTGRLLNLLGWNDAAGVDPREFQPQPTVFERAAANGVAVRYVGAWRLRDTPLTRAASRGAVHLRADAMGELVGRARSALREGDRSYVTVYHSNLDSTGHRCGVDSAEWRFELGFVDRLAEQITEVLPPGALLCVTADHGMVDPGERLDADRTPALQEGVALLGGDARCRYVYAEPGAAGDVLATWRAAVGDRAWVVPRDEAVADGWFGPVADGMAERIGDVVVVPHGGLAIVASEREPWLEDMIGMHGSMISAERLVPLLTASGPT
ncbi:alkaline phosphatase family protein [Actinomadura algeriensis]|uniref:Alkaline phosphatase family protein n=1 Tax=Actinomadura algeriensis TaxID=1679523 RepID=A0ABR9K4X3_9ACTN|nr:nucleotide pyrophosphatase/phosphodiesterase family protein [Actinomadura algeriensis]MBE1537876.1 hypothetical protein [Actinomadura algeriensis]